MPCRDFYDENPGAYYGERLADKDREIIRLEKRISFAESALCAALDSLEGLYGEDFFNTINFKEAGITRNELVRWRAEHKELDLKMRETERKVKERAERERQKAMEKKLLRANALAKLSPEERKALGVKGNE